MHPRKNFVEEVNGLAGPRCMVEASTEWTVQQVHEAIAEKIGVPVDWQKLVKSTERLPWEETVGSLISDGLDTLQLTLLVEEVPLPGPGALSEAIELRDEAAALELLKRHHLPGLNDVDETGRSALHCAIFSQLPKVALSILGRADFAALNLKDKYGCTALLYALNSDLPEVALAVVLRRDFSGINLKERYGQTALHDAAGQGFLAVCQAILDRDAFTELLAVDDLGLTALQVAEERGHHEVRDLLQAAEAGLAGAQQAQDGGTSHPSCGGEASLAS